MYEYDNSYVFMSLASAQQLAQLGNSVTGLEVRTRTRAEAPTVARAIEDTLGFPYRTEDWQAQNSSLFHALKLEKFGMTFILLLIVLVAAFNIVSTLTMVVTDKTREIGILRAMGMPARSIRRIFFAQGVVIGIVGTFAGLVLRSLRVGHDRSIQADRTGPIRIFHRSPACRDAATRRGVDRARESVDRRSCDAVSGAAGGEVIPGRGDSTRMTVLEAVDLAKTYTGGDGGLITVLDGVNLRRRARRDGGDRRRERRGEEHASASARRARPPDARQDHRLPASRSRTAPMRSFRCFAIDAWDSCFSFTTCCESSARSRT